jgi:hypothetical protein
MKQAVEKITDAFQGGPLIVGEYWINLKIPTDKDIDKFAQYKGYDGLCNYFQEYRGEDDYPIALVLIEKSKGSGSFHWVDAIGFGDGKIAVYDSMQALPDGSANIFQALDKATYTKHQIILATVSDTCGKCIGHQADFHYEYPSCEGLLFDDDGSPAYWWLDFK